MRGRHVMEWADATPLTAYRDLTLFTTAALILLLGVGVSVYRARPAAAPAKVDLPTDGSLTPDSRQWQSLRPVSNPDPQGVRQLSRCRPYHVVATSDGRKAYVTLAGTESQPGTQVVLLDVPQQRETTRIQVGVHPFGLALHPAGRWLVVTNRYSRFLSVIDVLTDEVTSEIPVPYYCEDLVFTADGTKALITNFYLQQVLLVDLHVESGRLKGAVRTLGFNREQFLGPLTEHTVTWTACGACGWRTPESLSHCPRCKSGGVQHEATRNHGRGTGSLRGVIRARCGNAHCHLYRTEGFYAGPDEDQLLQSSIAYAWPERPDLSPLLRAVTSVDHGGWANGTDGRHHPGGVVFADPERDADYQRLRAWIADGAQGPGISVGVQPRDLVLSPDQRWLYVANTGSTDISVVDMQSLREVRRIFTRSPVNDLIFVDGHLVLATLGVGSGHPQSQDAGRESLDRNHPEAEFTLFRDPATGRPLPLSQQEPLGPYDNTDGTRQLKFRDITNDIVILKPTVLDVASYRAEQDFTRYTSDSFEALPGDYKGDVPPALMKVVGAFPEQIVEVAGRLYVTMSGTFQVQEWQVDTTAAPTDRLIPGRVFTTGLKPTGIAIAGATLVVANQLSESVSLINLHDETLAEISLSRLPVPFPANDFERGEFFVQTSVFSVDQDQSCVHCHYRDASDGKRWSVSQVMGQSRNGEERTGGSREVPDLRNLVDEVPFFAEGTLSIDEPLTMIMEHNPLVDFQGATPAGDFDGIRASAAEATQQSADAIVVATGRSWDSAGVQLADLVKRREVHFASVSKTYLGHEYSIRDLQRMIGEYQRGEPRLLPNPIDPDDPMVLQGKALFMNPQVGCAGCHPPPTFTDKTHVRFTQNRSFPPLVSVAPRDNVHTLISADRIDAINGYIRTWDPADRGRIEEREGYFVAPSLRGLWARPPVLLHHGHAASLREVVCTPDHPALRQLAHVSRDVVRTHRREQGMNDNQGLPDTHGATSHLSVWDIECLVAYLNSIE